VPTSDDDEAGKSFLDQLRKRFERHYTSRSDREQEYLARRGTCVSGGFEEREAHQVSTTHEHTHRGLR